jgi:dihydroneopterin aldolase
MGQIKLNGMEFYAFHGCYDEERMTGNNFTVDITIDTDMQKAAKSDNICDALNYAQVYALVKDVMSIRSYLLENVCSRILDKLFDSFRQLNSVEVSVAKLNPPLGGPVKSVTVCQKRSR